MERSWWDIELKFGEDEKLDVFSSDTKVDANRFGKEQRDSSLFPSESSPTFAKLQITHQKFKVLTNHHDKSGVLKSLISR